MIGFGTNHVQINSCEVLYLFVIKQDELTYFCSNWFSYEENEMNGTKILLATFS